MARHKIKRALLSVYDKTGIVDFARALVEEFGIEIISTGGTAVLLKENTIPVTLVEEVTGFPEMMNGRVKTLHPKIHAAVLADRDNPDHLRQLQEQGIQPIDMVVVSLYPFEETVADPNCTFEQAIEMIDIGGPCLLRAAAKNHQHVLPVGGQMFYEECLAYLREEWPEEASAFRRWLACTAFEITSEYDVDVQCYLEGVAQEADAKTAPEDDGEGFLPEGAGLVQVWETSKRLRYGENPHQKAAFLGPGEIDAGCVAPDRIVAGEPASFNNYADADAALALSKELTRAFSSRSKGNTPYACVFAKHTNPCGVGVADEPIEAYRRAYLGDPNAAMGGILACNFEIKADFATAVMETYAHWGKEAGAGGFFIEVWVAPSFDQAALEVPQALKKWGSRVRLMAVGEMGDAPDETAVTCKTVSGGMLLQTPDIVRLNEEEWKVVTKRTPRDAELADLRLALLICKHTKSNTITVCKDNMLLGNGAGQMSRVMSCRIATWLAKENGHAEKLAGAVAASDAFFPFRDGPDILMDAGLSALIQPGGSKRDEDTIKACDERGTAMVFTGIRHFRH